MELFTISIRTIFFYFFIVVLYRIMGKREVGQLGIIDLIVSILIAELVAISIENYNANMLMSIIPAIILVMLEILFAYLNMKSKKIRSIFDGKPSLIICSGKVNYNEMVKQRYNLDDLLLSLRQKQIKSIEEVEYAFLENNGKLSVFKYESPKYKGNYPIPIIIDGELQEDTLKKLSKTEKWIKTEIAKNKLDIENIFYAFCRKNKLYIINKDKFIKNN